MKSPPVELAKTSCKNCCFAIYENITQTGCELGRVDRFRSVNKVVEAYDNDKEFYVIQDFCNCYRSNKDSVSVEEAKKQIAPTFDVLINCQDITQEASQKIKTFLDKITYYKNKIKVTFYYQHDQNKDSKSRALELIAIYQPLLNSSVSVCLETESYLQEYLFKKSPGTYVCLINCKNVDSLNSRAFEEINDKINNSLEKVLCAINDSMRIFSTYLYRICFYSKQEEGFVLTSEETIHEIMQLSQENSMIMNI